MRLVFGVQDWYRNVVLSQHDPHDTYGPSFEDANFCTVVAAKIEIPGELRFDFTMQHLHEFASELCCDTRQQDRGIKNAERCSRVRLRRPLFTRSTGN